MENLIISGYLVNPPTESLAFRTLTMFSRERFRLINLIEIEKPYVDIYYHYMKKMGIFDYIKEIIIPEYNEFGVRLDRQNNYPLTIVTDRIVFPKIPNLLGQLQNLNNL